MAENRSCKMFDAIDTSYEKTNCSSCKTWNGERCSKESIVVASQDPELIEPLKLCDW